MRTSIPPKAVGWEIFALFVGNMDGVRRTPGGWSVTDVSGHGPPPCHWLKAENLFRTLLGACRNHKSMGKPNVNKRRSPVSGSDLATPASSPRP